MVKKYKMCKRVSKMLKSTVSKALRKSKNVPKNAKKYQNPLNMSKSIKCSKEYQKF